MCRGCMILSIIRRSFLSYHWISHYVGNKLQRFLQNLKNKNFYNKEQQYDNIYPCGSRPARIYSILKTHKLNTPIDSLTFRPVFSHTS